MRLTLIILTILCAFACQNTITQEPPPETINVNFNLTGDFVTEGELPLVLAKSSADDIIAVQVYQRTNTEGSKYKPYCYGLWNDMSGMNVTLNRDMIYRFEVTVVPGARNIVALNSADNGLMQPFSVYGSGGNSQVGNRFLYSATNYLPYIAQGTTAVISGKSYNLYNRPVADRYYGELNDVLATESLGTLAIPTRRVVFGLQYNIAGFTEGTVKVMLKNSPEISLTPTTYQNARTLITLQGSLTDTAAWMRDDYTETISIVILWKKANGDEIEVTKKEVTFQRKTLYTVQIDLNKLQNSSGINFDSEDGTLKKGGNI